MAVAALRASRVWAQPAAARRRHWLGLLTDGSAAPARPADQWPIIEWTLDGPDDPLPPARLSLVLLIFYCNNQAEF
jgi:hypothetical protein